MKMNRRGVSTVVFATVVIALLLLAGGGFTLYLTNRPAMMETTTTLTQATTSTLTYHPMVSGGFLNNKVVTFIYTSKEQCNPGLQQLFSGSAEATAASAKTNCEVGAAGSFPSNTPPVWAIVPTYAGLSIFGVPQLGASPQGFPTYMNQTILTDCGAGGSAMACPDHPALIYSPAFTAVEQHLGMANGVFGLPEGVLPTPAHDHIVSTDAGGQSVPWYVVAVLVFDPDIVPNPQTGQCWQIVTSSLADPTGNCLTSLTALQNAMGTSNSAIAQANTGNPIWETLGKPTVQVVIPGASMVSEISNANSNFAVTFGVSSTNPYPPSQPMAITIGNPQEIYRTTDAALVAAAVLSR